MQKETPKQQEQLNEQLASQLERGRIRHLQVISLGNSIATGYSMTRTTKPLLLRNDTIEKIMKEHGITVTRKQFSRAQNNSDEHILEWIQENATEKTINEWNRKDFAKGDHCLITHGLEQSSVESYYPREAEELGLQDYLKTTDPSTANMVIYNGCTGSFLDGITRGGSLFQQLFYGVNRDVESLEAILKWMQINNRMEDSNIEVYLCGVPNIMGVGVSECINHKLKKASKKYANTTYVDPVRSKGIYCPIGEMKKRVFDVHYDEEEYQQMNNHILSSMINNHSLRRALINLDRKLYEQSKRIEFQEPSSQKEVEEFLREEMELLEKKDKKEFLRIARAYLLSRTPYDFYYLGRDKIEQAFQKAKNK